jgi:hypothetical protein
MFVYTQRALLLSTVLAFAACSGIGANGTTPSTVPGESASIPSSIDAVLDSAPEVAGGHFAFQKFSVRPDAKAPPMLMNFVSNGPNQGGVPCINCVLGASSGDNIGMTGPSSFVLKNAGWQYEMSFTDISVTGKCKLAWAITSDKKTIDSFSATLNLTSAGGFVLFGVARNRPKYSGPATLTGKATCGKNSGKLNAPLYFQ